MLRCAHCTQPNSYADPIGAASTDGRCVGQQRAAVERRVRGVGRSPIDRVSSGKLDDRLTSSFLLRIVNSDSRVKAGNAASNGVMPSWDDEAARDGSSDV